MSPLPETKPRPLDAVEARLLAALDAGDHRAVLTGLMSAYGNEVLRFCVGMLGDGAAAEDARQTVFIEAYDAVGSYDRRSTLRAWLFGVARHRCLDALKARRRLTWRFWSAPDAGAREIDAAPGADARLEADERAAILRECLRALPPGARVVVLLRYEEGLAYDEIARLTDERPAAVQARVARALPLVRTCVERKGVVL